MTSNEDHDLDSITKKLTDGFTLLCNEYKKLAEQHRKSQNTLSIATTQCQQLRQLVDNPTADRVASLKELKDEETRSFPARSLDDWLDEVQATDITKLRAVTQIKEAEFACFTLQTRLKAGGGVRRSQAPSNESVRSARYSKRPRPRFTGSVLPDIEQDFTTPGVSGNLHCPFTSLNADGIKDSTCAVNNLHDLPTPKNSDSQVPLSSRRSQRPSFVDPLRPHLKVDPSPAVSETHSNGPGCPIRFLDQHDPEEIANYFEQHKNELPRSHEMCIKRFQSNADSIRELDAKYGNLVTMVQGLGQKHKPMLSVIPKSEEHAIHDEDSRSNRRVKQWAKDVNSSQCVMDADAEVPALEQLPPEEVPEDARESHFDRPLKEVRVGESPSRPWGVHIPVKYLEKAGVTSPNESEEGLGHASIVVEVPEGKGEELEVPAVSKAAVTGTKPKGKCPFDHTKMIKQPAKTNEAVKAQDDQQELVSEVPQAKDTKPAVTRPTLPAYNQAHQLSEKPVAASACMTNQIVNHGVAIIYDTKALHNHSLTNHGTLILGFEEQSARRMIYALNAEKFL